MRVRSFRKFPLALSLLLCATLFVLWVRKRMDRIVPLAPRIYLSWNGVSWSVLDDRHTPKGLDPPPGGTVVVDNVASIEVANGKHLIGKTRDGEFFVMDLREPGSTASVEDPVRHFASEEEWRAACRAIGVSEPRLRDPDDF